ncbi:MAG: oxidoreductase, partial [Porphyrobacter sp.]|nr:oxidoreductase [Porphyrobacter sp.]
RDPDGAMLPAFEAGAHVDVALGNGLLRQYSLCGSPAERDCYRPGVGLAPDSRGGSRYIHEQLQTGERIDVSEPRQLVGLHAASRCPRSITATPALPPILSMIHRGKRSG